MSSLSGRFARVIGAVALGLGLFAAPSVALAAKSAAKTTSKVAAHSKGSAKKGAQSVGAPNHGHLAGAVRLRGSKVLHQREGAHSWALPQLVTLISHSAAAVSRKHPRSQMLVGDLSGRTGGHLDHHGSHQTGRDADVGFYVMNSKGKPMAVKRFIAFDDAGNARDVPGAHFDEARNWTMIESMLRSQKATVRYLFITNGLKSRLLAYANKKHIAHDIIEKASMAMMSPADADLHDDHVHVRIACPESMRDVCVEESTAREERQAAPKGEHPDKQEKPEKAEKIEKDATAKVDAN